MKRVFLAGILGAGSALAAVSPALASQATISGNGKTVSVTAGANESNVITVSYAAGTDTYVVTDTANLTKAGTCLQADPHMVTCPGVGITSISVDSGKRNDVINVDPASVPKSVPTKLDGGGGDDSVSGGSGEDDMTGGSGRDVVNGRDAADDINGGSGTDTLVYPADRTTPLQVTVGTGNGNDGNELDQTGAERDTVHGDVETVIGSAAGDILIGDNGDETLIGGAGNDTLVGQGGRDNLFGFEGDDLLSGGDRADTLRGSFGNDILLGGPDGDRLAGGPDNDLLKGKSGSDVMKGKTGIDVIRARDGFRDVKISCGPGRNGLENAKRDRRLDPKARSC